MHGWRGQLELHREELLRLSDELDRVRAEMKAQARRPVDEVKAAKDAAKNEMKAQARDATRLKGRGRRR